jgi:antibiotic biosynthesis monooxygenase (ABM) superfamily enzyme
MMNPTAPTGRVDGDTRTGREQGREASGMADRVVTISVSYPVTPGEEGEFEAWSRLRLAESADRPGYLGGQVLAPPAPGPDWFIVHRFDTERAASEWEAWFRGTPGFQQAGDIEWKVERAAGDGRRPPGPPDAGPRRNGQPRAARPEPPQQRGGPYGVRPVAPGGPRPTPPGAVAVVGPPAPPRQSGPPPVENRPRDPARPVNGAAARPAPVAPRTTPPAADEPSQVASMVVTAAVVVLFTAVFETAIAPLLSGGPVLVRIVLLSAVITGAVSVVRPPGMRRWLANLLVPVARRNRLEREKDARDQPR